jgi:SAM-dependent methyltransferase
MSRLIDKTCLVCKAQGARVCEAKTRFKRLDSVPDQYIVKCIGCGIVTRSPSLFSPQFDKDANVNLREDGDFIGGYPGGVAPHIRSRLEFAESALVGRRLLDVGCGSGALLNLAKDRGWTCFGTEARPEAVKELAEFDIQVFIGDLDNPELAAMRFDLIHMNHVLEHVMDPVSVLASVHRLLSTDGLAIVEVPNEFNAITQRLRQGLGLDGSSLTTYFQHEWFFNPETLKYVCQKSGLKIRKLHTPYRSSNNKMKDPLRFAASAMGSGDVIEVILEK